MKCLGELLAGEMGEFQQNRESPQGGTTGIHGKRLSPLIKNAICRVQMQVSTAFGFVQLRR